MLLRTLCAFVFISCCVQVLECKRQLPSFIKVCHRSDPERVQCMKSSVESLRPYLGKGIPAMRIPVLDPLRITTLDISQNNIQLVYTDYDIEALHEFTIDNFDASFDSDKCFLTLDVHYPHLNAKGDYHMKGQLLLFQLDGEGEVSINFTSVGLSSKLNCEIVTRQNKEYVELTDIDMKVKIEDFRINMTNLFRNSPETTKSVNAVFNQNSKSLIEEFELVINKAIGEVILQTARDVFRSFPRDILTPP